MTYIYFAEMLLPQETYGKTFVIPELCVGRKHLGCYFLTAGENNSKVFIHEAEDVVLINLRHAGKSEQVTVKMAKRLIHFFFSGAGILNAPLSSPNFNGLQTLVR